ncbi:hypothetical protein [Ponticaulis profundi]|uniref:VWA domain-containing protein n=1 Tax=Ponticaulis profundi TaxID=2665222 RepID=A0ABW1S5U2_9PROT
MKKLLSAFGTLLVCMVSTATALASPFQTSLVSMETRFVTSSIRVYWDSSLIPDTTGLKARAFLWTVIDEARPYSLELVTFSDGLSGPHRLDLRPEGEELDYFAGRQNQQAFADLTALFRNEAHTSEVETCFLVTDGHFTAYDLPNNRLPCTLHVISAKPDADREILSELARRGGGKFLDLSNMSEAQAYALLGRTS